MHQGNGLVTTCTADSVSAAALALPHVAANPNSPDMKQDHKWWLVSTGAALLASSLTKSVMERSYLRATGRRPPQNPASPRVQWRSAFGWAMAAGVLVSLSEMLAERGAAAGWKKATGKYPRSLLRKKT